MAFLRLPLVVVSTIVNLLAAVCIKGAPVRGYVMPDLLDITVDDIVKGFAAKQFTSVQLVEGYIARISRCNLC